MASVSEMKRPRTKSASRHADWLSLIEISGPFLTLPVLDRIFPQGLDARDPELRRELRTRFAEWEAEQEKRAAGSRHPPAPGSAGCWTSARLSARPRSPKANPCRRTSRRGSPRKARR